jgi:hypothetical protein
MIAKGTQVLYHSEHGDFPAWVVEYVAGRDEGDHFVAGWTTPEAQKAGQGPYFADWSVVGHEHGAFSPV